MNIHLDKIKDTSPRIAIIGLGNLLLMDDGVGVHAVLQMKQESPAQMPLDESNEQACMSTNPVIAEVGTSALYAIGLFEEADVVIAIDAVKAEGKPGDIYIFDSSSAQVSNQHVSLHDLGIMGILRLLPEEKRPRVIVLGVGTGSDRLRDGSDGDSAGVLPQVIALVNEMVQVIMRGENIIQQQAI